MIAEGYHSSLIVHTHHSAQRRGCSNAYPTTLKGRHLLSQGEGEELSG